MSKTTSIAASKIDAADAAPSSLPRNSNAPRSPAARGAPNNPPNRFVRIELEPDADWYDPDERPVATEFYRDDSLSILSRNDSPDIPFTTSVNPYRGCEHGCVYCYARPTHEYLGFSAGLDFEARILVKERAPELLRDALQSDRWDPQPIAMSGVTDPYQPVERKLRLTRRCLEVLLEFRNPVTVVTKNQLITRDVDLLTGLARHHAVAVMISLTTLDPGLRRVMEPRTSPPPARLTTVRLLADAGIPVGILMSPVIPGLTDHEVPRLLAAAAAAGAQWAGYVPLRLPLGVEPIFVDWLSRYYPQRQEKILNRLLELRGGRLNDPRFGDRMTGTGKLAAQLNQLFHVSCRRAGLGTAGPRLSVAAFRRPEPGGQLSLFD